MTHVLYIGGTGEISQACVDISVKLGHNVTLLNRGQRQGAHPTNSNVHSIFGDLANNTPYANLAGREFDVVCQFLAFEPEQVKKDIEFFKDACQHYIFISTASAYQKPHMSGLVTEATPLDNPFWEYSRKKAECETLVKSLCELYGLDFTIVRPSHTYRTRMPGAIIDGDHQSWRILNGKPVIVHGDGQSLWTLTYASDFAHAFVRLFNNPAALNEDFHITRDCAHTWDTIVETSARVMDCNADIVHVTCDTLIAFREAWRGPLLGDKANNACFDNQKLINAIGDWSCQIELEAGVSLAWEFAQLRLAQNYKPDESMDRLVDKIISAQN